MMSNTSLSAQIAEMETNDWVAPDCRGLNFFEIDNSLQDLMKLYLDKDLLSHMLPHYRRLGKISGLSLIHICRCRRAI